jgi:hypothetical protein
LGDLLRNNLLSPITLAFALGLCARLVRSEFQLPRDVYAGLSIYLLFGLGLKGGAELVHADPSAIGGAALATIGLGVATPIIAYLVLRRLGRFGVADAAGIAAHYGSVSAVTYLAAIQFAKAAGAEPEGFMPTLLALLETPGIAVALAIGAFGTAQGQRRTGEVLHEVLTGRTMVLLVGGLVIGALAGERGWEMVGPFYDSTGAIFRGALCLFLLEMGVLAGTRLSDLRKAGPFLLAFGLLLPVVHGALGAWVGTQAGLSVGGATVLAAMAASASYIAAPPAVRMTLPDANPTYYLTASLAITFPFNLLAGIPLYHEFARAFAR